MVLKIIQSNARSIRSNRGDLELFIHEKNVHVALINDTWLKKDSHFSSPSYRTIWKDTQDGYGAVTILVKNNFSYQQLVCPAGLPETECVGITIVTKSSTKLNIYIIYRRPQVNVDSAGWITFLDSLDKPFVIGGDFNVHYTLWDSSSSERGGSALFEATEEVNLVALNDGSPTILSAPGSSLSAVDLSFCLSSLATQID